MRKMTNATVENIVQVSGAIRTPLLVARRAHAMVRTATRSDARLQRMVATTRAIVRLVPLVTVARR